MLSCDEYRELITGYVDNQLTDTEIFELQQHLLSCDSCKHLAIQEQELHEMLTAHSPLFNAPESLKEKIHVTLSSKQSLPPVTQTYFKNTLFLAGTFACILFAVMLLAWRSTSTKNKENNVSEFAELAVDTHLRRMRNQLPLEVVSESPEVVSRWFSNKVNFHFELPNYPVSPGYHKKYALEGARLVSFNNDYAANVSYRLNGSLISLVVLPEDVAAPSGGKEIEVGDIRFHTQDYLGFHVITWSHRGLTYALVSDLTQGHGQDSCMVCHQETEKERITLHP